MTDKEYKEAARKKADELIEKFRSAIYGNPQINNSSFSRQLAENKKATYCAKIAVQEILDLDVVWYRKEAVGKQPFIRAEMAREFWEEVMNKLNK